MGIGHTIRMLRTARKVSQGDLARILEVTPGYLSLVEQDKREPSLGLLNRVGEYFGVPVGFLLLGAANQHAVPEYQRLINEIKHAMVDYMVSRPVKKVVGGRKAAAK
ncbi:MAG: helix-turn-helix domain-containing protein [Candidatus Acidiferrales bacterium]